MRVSVLQENLAKGLGIVGRAVATKSTLPIISNILITTDESRLKLSATNLEIAINCWIGAKVEEEGSITIPARLTGEFVNTLPADRVDLQIAPKSHALQIRCDRFDARINGLEPEDFPPIPAYADPPTATIEPDALRAAIHQVAFAAAIDDSRPVLTGVYAQFQGNDLTMAAADGFRLAVHTATLSSGPAEAISVIVPGKTFIELGRLLSDQTDPVEIQLLENKNQILFHLNTVDVVSQLIQGTFPNYQQLIPNSYSTRTLVNKNDFLRATRVASIFARDSSGIVGIQMSPGEGSLGPGKLTVNSKAEEMAENSGELEAMVEGDEGKVAFNGKYLADVLAVIDEEQVALETTSPSSPGVIRPIGADNYTHVVMPMFVQW